MEGTSSFKTLAKYSKAEEWRRILTQIDRIKFFLLFRVLLLYDDNKAGELSVQSRTYTKEIGSKIVSFCFTIVKQKLSTDATYARIDATTFEKLMAAYPQYIPAIYDYSGIDLPIHTNLVLELDKIYGPDESLRSSDCTHLIKSS
jgi:hypothetical protein